MKNINAPPKHLLKASVGVDSVFLQFRKVYKRDVDLFCQDLGLSYGDSKRGEYTRRWEIFLAGGQPISVVYHLSSKTMTFQVGRLMNYTRNPDDQHRFLQALMCRYADKPMKVSRLDFSVDIKEPTDSFILKSRQELESKRNVGSTVYFNSSNGTVFTVYDKAAQLKIYSTTLTRFELRLKQQLAQWKVEDFTENRESLEKLASKIEHHFKNGISLCSISGKRELVLAIGNIAGTLEDFIAFLHGGELPALKDHFKIVNAIANRDAFISWMKTYGLKTIDDVKRYIKGRRQSVYDEIQITHMTFNKALSYYEGIYNFKVSA